jgi:hypothetical protein
MTKVEWLVASCIGVALVTLPFAAVADLPNPSAHGKSSTERVVHQYIDIPNPNDQ